MSSDSQLTERGMGEAESAAAPTLPERRDRLADIAAGSTAATTISRADDARVLLFNWRDRDHPDAGGAEEFTHQVLERLVERGHQATMITAAFDGCESETEMDGVRVVRSGGPYSVYGQAVRRYRALEEQFDVVVDEINGPAFMTPAYVDEPIVALVHHVIREAWYTELPRPLASVGNFLQDWWLKLYRSVPTVTVSTSTRRELEDLGFSDVRIVPEGIDREPVPEVPAKPDRPTFAFLGRMNRSKRPMDTLRAFEHLKTRYPDAHLHMIGDGYMVDRLRDEAGEDVTVHGYVSEERKYELLERSHLLLVTSVREGWGLVVTEANAAGTPAVGYNVKGLRDSIRNGENGLLTAEDPLRLAQRAVTVLETDYERYASQAVEVARRHDWEATTDGFERTLLEVVE